MSNFFNTRRAVNFFVYDLKTAKNNYLLSLVICGIMPAIFFVFSLLLSLLIKPGSPVEVSLPMQILSFYIGIIVAVVTFPTKQYGGLTDKKYGSDWLMLPASSFEKWLSMFVVSFIVFPLCLFTLMLSCDWLLSVIFPSLYPQALFKGEVFKKLAEISGDSSPLRAILSGFNWRFWLIFGFGSSVLCFVLGAIFFKKSKFAKTLLVLFVMGALISFATMAVFGISSFTFTPESISTMVDEGSLTDNFQRYITSNCIWSVLCFILINCGIYFRLKTLKH